MAPLQQHDVDWILRDDREKLQSTVNDIINELMDVDMEAQAGVAVVGEYVQGRSRGNVEGGRQREELGDAVHGRI